MPAAAFPFAVTQGRTDDYMVYLSESPGKSVAAIIAWLEQAGDPLVDLRVERPSLEERFLEITTDHACKRRSEMTAFIHHLAYDFKTGIRDRSKLLMFYLFPVVFFALMGGLMALGQPRFQAADDPRAWSSLHSCAPRSSTCPVSW